MQDDRAFADILQKCLEAIADGQAGVEDCLNRYPQHATPLGEALRLSLRIRAVPLPAPTPEMLAAGEQRLLQAARLKAPAGCGRRLRSVWAWLACGMAAALGGVCFLACLILVVVIVIVKPCPPCPTPTLTPTYVPTVTRTASSTWTPTAPPTVTATCTPTATCTATATGTPAPPPSPTATPVSPTPTPLPTDTPLPTNTPIPPAPTPAGQPKPSLGFHPDELRAEGCAAAYQVTGSLKNHGGEAANWAANVQIGYEVVKGAEYVARVAVSPDFWPVIGGNETVSYTIVVDTTTGWQGQRDKEIKVRLYIAREDNRPGHHQTQAHFTIVNRCP